MLVVEADAFREEVDLLDLDLGWEGPVEESLVFVGMKASISSLLDKARRRSFSWAAGSGGREWERMRSSVSVRGFDD